MISIHCFLAPLASAIFLATYLLCWRFVRKSTKRRRDVEAKVISPAMPALVSFCIIIFLLSNSRVKDPWCSIIASLFLIMAVVVIVKAALIARAGRECC